jgi:tRNA1Val (adenine37-N6)-methyltransferase
VPHTPPPDDETTLDTMFRGRITLRQSRRGYRFGIDSVLLAAHAARHRPERFVDIGAGCGIVSLALDALLGGTPTGVAVEIQPSLFTLLRENIDRNGASDRIHALHADARDAARALGSTPADVVVMNPPYFEPGHGHLNPGSERARARHQLDGSLAELLRAARRCAGPLGSVEFVYPAQRLAAVCAILLDLGLRSLTVRLVHPTADRPAELVLVSARPSRRDAVVTLPPLVIRASPEVYTDEVHTLLGGQLCPTP